MPRWNTDRLLSALAVTISLTLTWLIVSAVARQGLTLEARELDAERQAAQHAAIEREREFRLELENWLYAATAARDIGEDALDSWTCEQRFWWFVGSDDRGGTYHFYPRTPTEAPLPLVYDDQLEEGEVLEFADHDPTAAVEHYESLSETADGPVVVSALLAAAANSRKLGLLRAAARDYMRAAEIFDADPAGWRGAFGARLAVVDCQLDRLELPAARHELGLLLDAMAAAHTAAFGPAEVALVQSRVEAIPRRPFASDPFDEMLTQLARRAEVRAALPAIQTALLSTFPPTRALAPEEIAFATLKPAQAAAMLAVVQRTRDDRQIVLVATLDNVIRRYWYRETPERRWRVLSPAEAAEGELFCRLPECFGGLALTPSRATLTRLRESAQRRLGFLVSVSIGTTGAWAVVIWLVMRALNRRRELVRMQQQFMADMSHELKTPLALIRLSAETLEAGRVSDAERAREYHQTIARESERLTMLLDNILDFSRLASGRRHYDMSRCDPGQIVRQAWSLFQPRLREEGFECQLDIAPDLPTITADPAALEQVLVNLLQNAHRYSSDRKYLRVAVWRRRNEVLIEVEDHGIGMARSQLRRLGRGFERGADPRVRKTRGTGLGLAIVKRITAAHQGKVEVRSELGKGSTFTVRIPVESEEA